MTDIDYGPPVRIGGDKPGGVIKIKRGGATRNGNSGNAPKRFYTPNRANRDNKGNKKGRHYGGKILPWPSRGKPIWDPTDPFIIAYREAHPVVEAAWRTKWQRPAPERVVFDIETCDGI